jgi:hypothetical protein
MPKNNIGFYSFKNPGRREGVPHVGITDTRRHIGHARVRGQQCGLTDAEPSRSGKNPARPIVRRVGEIDVRIVDDAVADGGIKAQDCGAGSAVPSVVCFANAMTCGESLSMKTPAESNGVISIVLLSQVTTFLKDG